MPDTVTVPPAPTLAELQLCGADELLTNPTFAVAYP